MRRDKAIADGVQVTGEEGFNYFMTILYPEDNLMILDYNRVLKTLNGMSSEKFLSTLENSFNISKHENRENHYPGKKNTMSLLTGGEWYEMTVKNECLKDLNAVSSLDT